MSHVNIILPSKDEEENPKLYIANKLVPMVANLYRICNELVLPQLSDEENLDMTTIPSSHGFKDIDRKINNNALKSFSFELDRNLPLYKENKKLYALFVGTFYVTGGTCASFRLMRTRDSMPITESIISCIDSEPREFSKILHIKNADNFISPQRETYHIQAKTRSSGQAVCRRFSINTYYQ